MGRGKKLKLMTREQVERIPEERRVKVLSDYTTRLLDLCVNPDIMLRVFEARAEIADVLEMGGEPLAHSARFYREMESVLDLAFNAGPSKADRQAEPTPEFPKRRPGFYVIAATPLTPEERVEIRKANCTPYKAGNPIPIKFAHLFREDIVKDDNKPIYLLDAPSEDTVKALAALLMVRPELKPRLFFLNWNDSGLSATPVVAGSPIPLKCAPSGETALALKDVERVMGEMPSELAYNLKHALNKVPNVGEVYRGRVTRIATFGVFVNLTPGRDGLVHCSRLPMPFEEWKEQHVVGSPLLVQVLDVDRRRDYHNPRIRLDAKEIPEDADVQYEAPMFLLESSDF